MSVDVDIPAISLDAELPIPATFLDRRGEPFPAFVGTAPIDLLPEALSGCLRLATADVTEFARHDHVADAGDCFPAFASRGPDRALLLSEPDTLDERQAAERLASQVEGYAAA